MTVYIDLVIIINFIIDFIILLAVDILLKRNMKIKYIIYSSLFGGFSIILLMYISSNIIILLYKIIVSMIMVIIAFKYNSFNYFNDNLFWLYIISIILGGTIYLIDNQISLSNNGIIFTKNNIKINFLFIALLSFLIIYKYVKKEKNYHNEYSNYYKINIYYGDVKLTGMAFLDTGNNLFDPYFHYPIILVDQKLLPKTIKTFLVPYDTLNNHNLLKVFKPKKIIVNKKCTKKVLIGLSDINYNGIKIILNKEII